MFRALLLPAILLLATGCGEPVDTTPVRATLSDGQVLAGQVRTDTLFLDGEMGTLAIPLSDVGEVLPIEGAHLDGSGGRVTVWLRNGSEFRGTWADPELAMELDIGGSAIDVDLPVADLTRFQLQGGTVWPEQPIFRVATVAGDDFLVDPDASRIAISNELGSFAPYLSECAAIRRLGDQWQLTLHSGTVLIGTPDASELDFVLAMGPETVTVPIDRLDWMQWEDWGGVNGTFGGQPVAAEQAIHLQQAAEPEPADAPAMAAPKNAPRRSVDHGDGWFSNEMLYDAKH